MIDYGAVVFKNGEQMNHELFDDMLKAVGWVDRKRLLYEDCDRTWGYGVSDCSECPRAKWERRFFEDGMEYDVVIGDCRWNELPKGGGSLDGNYYAYIGDPHLTFAFYKTHFIVCVDGKVVDSVWGSQTAHYKWAWYSWRKEYCKPENEFWADGVKIHVNRIAGRVFHFSMDYNGDHYHVIYGYGIDPDMRVWNRVKVKYLGKTVAKKVDRLYRRIKGDV